MSGLPVLPPESDADLGLLPDGVNLTVTVNSPSGPDSQPDPNTGATASLRWPRYGTQCVLINQSGANNNVNCLSQSITVGPALINPIDGQTHICFVIAPVLQNPHHQAPDQPYYFFQLSDDTQGTILYSDFGELGDTNMPWQVTYTNSVVDGYTEFDCTDWQLVDIVPGTNVAAGDQITLTATASGCAFSGHMGQMYMDGVGSAVPGIYVEAQAPPVAFQAAALAYTLTYRNGSPSNETGVVICFNTPVNTTFQSLCAPGLTVSALPALGTPGRVICTLSNLPPGASGTLTVTVNIISGASTAIIARDYSICSDTETPLLGPRVQTVVANVYPIQIFAPTLTSQGNFAFSFTNIPGSAFTILNSADASLPISQWNVAGTPTENPPGTYTFTNSSTAQSLFYAVRSP